MTQTKIPLPPLFLAFTIIFMLPFFISPVLADEVNYTEINLTDIPYRVADSLNIDVFAGQLICSCIFMMILLLPITIIARSKHASWIPEVAMALIAMGICIGIGWLPVWFLLILSLLIALMFAGKMRDVITGAGGK